MWFHGVSMGCPSQFYVTSIVFLRYFFVISKGCLWNLNGIPLGIRRNSTRFLLDFYRILFRNPLGFPWYGTSMGFLWVPKRVFHDVSLIFPWHFYWFPVKRPWYFYMVSMWILWYFDGIPMGFLWQPSVISMMFLWYFSGIPVMVFPWDSSRVSVGFPWGSMESLWHFYGIPVGFLWVSCGFHGISLGFLWYF